MDSISSSGTSSEFSEIHKRFWLSACECNYQNITSILRDSLVMVNWQDPINGMSALHYAAKFGDAALVKLLAGTYKADVDLIDHAGRTPLHICVQFNQLDTARLLRLDYNASVDKADYSGHLPIHYATSETYPKFISFLRTNKGFTRNVESKKQIRSFEDLPTIMLARKSQTKDDIGPVLRKSLWRMSEESRSAMYLDESDRDGEETEED